jgi:hypothetical protein
MDNISCDPSVTDPHSSSFCSAENTNIDYPPTRTWARIGVHYYDNRGQTYDVHPTIQVYCDGRLAAKLGPTAYGAPVTFVPGDATSRFWLVADVAFADDECGNRGCVVEPLYLDSVARTPVFSTAAQVSASFGPPYPPMP